MKNNEIVCAQNNNKSCFAQRTKTRVSNYNKDKTPGLTYDYHHITTRCNGTAIMQIPEPLAVLAKPAQHPHQLIYIHYHFNPDTNANESVLSDSFE